MVENRIRDGGPEIGNVPRLCNRVTTALTVRRFFVGGGSESGPGAPLQVYGARQAAKLDRSCDPWATCRAVRVCDRYLHTTGREVLTADDSQRRTSSCCTTFLYGNTSCVWLWVYSLAMTIFKVFTLTVH